jgi:hypothetical protein
MSQDNIAILSVAVERVAVDFSRLLCVSSQSCYTTKGLDPIFGTPTTSSPLNEINDIDMGPSDCLIVE